MHGATEEEIDQAVADGVIDLFVADRLLVPSRRRYTRAEVAELTGVSLDKLERFWRALGFPGVDDDEPRLHRPRPRGGTPLPGPAGPRCGRRRDGGADGPGHRLVHGPHRRGGAGARRHGERRGRPGPLGRGVRQRRRRDHSRHGQAARVRLAAPGGGGDPAQHDVAQPRPGARAEPGAGRGVRRHGRLHAAEPAPQRRGAGRRGAPLRGDLPRHRDRAPAAGWSR